MCLPKNELYIISLLYYNNLLMENSYDFKNFMAKFDGLTLNDLPLEPVPNDASLSSVSSPLISAKPVTWTVIRAPQP
jgi:hypothetical protein